MSIIARVRDVPPASSAAASERGYISISGCCLAATGSLNGRTYRGGFGGLGGPKGGGAACSGSGRVSHLTTVGVVAPVVLMVITVALCIARAAAGRRLELGRVGVQCRRRQVGLLVIRPGATVKLAQGGGALAVDGAAVVGGELAHRLGGQSGRLVVDGGGVVRLVDGHRLVDDMRVDRLLVNDGLDVLMDVVVDVLSRDGACRLGRICRLVGHRGALVAGGILLESGARIGLIAMVVLSVLDGASGMRRFLGPDNVGFMIKEECEGNGLQRLMGLDGLDPGLVVILVNLLVDSGGENLMLVRADVLLGHGLPDILVDNGVVLAIPG